MKNNSKRLVAIWIAVGLWMGGNFLLPSQPAISQDPEAKKIPLCTQYTVETASPLNCGNQVNGQCNGDWFDSYYYPSDCNHGTKDDDNTFCISGTAPAEGYTERGPCYPIQGGTPAICQPGPAAFHDKYYVPDQPACTQSDTPVGPPQMA